MNVPQSSARQRRVSFASAFQVQCRVIGALIMRELHTRYGRDNIGYLWLVGEPLLLATVIGLVHGAQGHSAFGPDIEPIAFGVLGYTLFIQFRSIVNRAEGGLEANGSLLYHRQVTVLDITISRALLEFAGAFMTVVTLMSLLIALGVARPPFRPLAFIAAWVVMFFYATGHSLVISSFSYENRTFGRLVHPYSYFMVFLSGAFTPLHWLPHPAREWLTWIPITSIFELLRYGWFESPNLDYFFPTYLIGSCVVLNWIGLISLVVTRKRIHLA